MCPPYIRGDPSALIKYQASIGLTTEFIRSILKGGWRQMNKLFGRRATDKINGFTGIITAEANYMTGCKQVLVDSETLGDNGKAKSKWIDFARLTVESTPHRVLDDVKDGDSGPVSHEPPK